MVYMMYWCVFVHTRGKKSSFGEGRCQPRSAFPAQVVIGNHNITRGELAAQNISKATGASVDARMACV